MRRTPTPSFSEFKRRRKAVAAALFARKTASTTLKFGKLKQSRDKLLTVFEATRVHGSPNGSKFHVLSTTIYTKKFTVELISSSPQKKAADANSSLFKLALMALSGKKSKR